MDIEKFELAYQTYCKNLQLLKDGDSDLESTYEKYLSSQEVTIDIFFELLSSYKLNYTNTIKFELNSLVLNSKTEFQNSMSIPFFDDCYQNADCKIVFYFNVLLTRKPDEDFSATVLEIGKSILHKENWAGISQVFEVLSIFSNPIALPLLETVFKKLEEDNQFYDGELGNNIMLYLMSLKREETYTFINKNQDVKIEGLARILEYLKEVRDEINT
jgi:hypothetical protein